MEFLERNTDISHLSNFRTPARAKYFFDFGDRHDIDKLSDIYSFARDEDIPVLVVSGGTNMLFGFELYEGIVIHNTLVGWSYDEDSEILITSGAEPIWDIAASLESDFGQELWHRFIGLPGSIAGAVYGNAGCFGLETQNNFESCEVLDIELGEVRNFQKDDMCFNYRTSRLKQEKKYFLLSATFNLSEKREKYHSEVDNIDFRENRQPKGHSCGSFFKNPTGIVVQKGKDDVFIVDTDEIEIYKKSGQEYQNLSAGYLIESVGLKGYHHGGAYMSEQHANFLMSDGSATHNDLLELIRIVQLRVADEYGIALENEVQIITNP